jgi:hypothetical protein
MTPRYILAHAAELAAIPVPDRGPLYGPGDQAKRRTEAGLGNHTGEGVQAAYGPPGAVQGQVTESDK